MLKWKRNMSLMTTVCIALVLAASSAPGADDQATKELGSMVLHQSVAVKDVCAWPNLTRLPNGEIAAAIFNKPAHGSLAGDVDVWVSTDDGKTWQLRGTAAPSPGPDSNRMNASAGIAGNGDLLVVSSGYRGVGTKIPFVERLLSPVVCRSEDNGATWSHSSDVSPAPDGQDLIPFGDILPGADGRLRLMAYTAASHWATYMLASDDDGRSWGHPVKLDDAINETALLHLGDGKWLAAARTHAPAHPSGHAELWLYRSEDDGATWHTQGAVTANSQVPAHLLRLADGRVLLVYGDRRAGHTGIAAQLSEDDGATWGEELRILELPQADLGYPSSVQLADGAVLTAYYAKQGPGYDGYHMGVVTWSPPSPE